MNCKQGDLAITIDSRNNFFAGKVVEVIKFMPKGSRAFSSASRRLSIAIDCDVWLVEHKKLGTWLHSDSRMRPIRHGDLNEDIDAGEKLPKKETA